MWRYNPDSTSGRAVRVRSDSPEADSWPTSRPRHLTATQRTAIIRTGEKIASVAVPAALVKGKAAATVARAAVSRAVKIGGAPVAAAAAELGIATTGALVVAAFGVGYAIGTGLRALWEHYQPEERDYRKALAFREARKRWVIEHGREMTADEVRAMGRGFLESLSNKGLAPSQR